MRFADILMTAATQGSGLDTLNAWVASVVANGGTVSAGRAAIVGTFIAAERASGAWDLTDDYWVFWGEDSIQALTSLKQRRLATAVNTPTFTTDRDYAFNGTTSYLNTGFIPSTHARAYTSSVQRIAVYERTNLSSAGIAAGVTTATSNRATITPRAGSIMAATLNNTGSTITFTLGVADSRGLKAASRAGGATALGYDRGVRLTDFSGFSANVGIPTSAVYIGANNNGGALNFRAASIGFVAIGAPLSNAQELAQYNAVQAWATSVGANV